jgi:hypothetical protein
VARAPSNVSDQGQKQAIVGNGSPGRLALQAEVSATLHARSNSTWSSAFVASAIPATPSTIVLESEQEQQLLPERRLCRLPFQLQFQP